MKHKVWQSSLRGGPTLDKRVLKLEQASERCIMPHPRVDQLEKVLNRTEVRERNRHNLRTRQKSTVPWQRCPMKSDVNACNDSPSPFLQIASALEVSTSWHSIWSPRTWDPALAGLPDGQRQTYNSLASEFKSWPWNTGFSAAVSSY